MGEIVEEFKIPINSCTSAGNIRARRSKPSINIKTKRFPLTKMESITE
jgi:hypothetical protein